MHTFFTDPDSFVMNCLNSLRGSKAGDVVCHLKLGLNLLSLYIRIRSQDVPSSLLGGCSGGFLYR